MMRLEVKKAKREAQGHKKRSKSKPEPERQFQEHQHIRELKNEFQMLGLGAPLEMIS